jgi:hypothetical protein
MTAPGWVLRACAAAPDGAIFIATAAGEVPPGVRLPPIADGRPVPARRAAAAE